MAIFIGDKQLKRIRMGRTDIAEVWVGNYRIWPTSYSFDGFGRDEVTSSWYAGGSAVIRDRKCLTVSEQDPGATLWRQQSINIGSNKKGRVTAIIEDEATSAVAEMSLIIGASDGVYFFATFKTGHVELFRVRNNRKPESLMQSDAYIPRGSELTIGLDKARVYVTVNGETKINWTRNNASIRALADIGIVLKGVKASGGQPTQYPMTIDRIDAWGQYG